MKYENIELGKWYLVFSVHVSYYPIQFESISASANQRKFKKVLYVRQIISINFLLKRARAN